MSTPKLIEHASTVASPQSIRGGSREACKEVLLITLRIDPKQFFATGDEVFGIVIRQSVWDKSAAHRQRQNQTKCFQTVTSFSAVV
jgi:hypothetical protein